MRSWVMEQHVLCPPNSQALASILKQVCFLRHISPVDLDLLNGSILLICLDQAQLLDNLHAALDPAKYRVFSVEPWRRRECDEELGAVRVRSRIGHAEDASAGVLQCWRDFVLKLFAIDRCAAPSSARGITALNHEVGYDAMED